MRDPRGKPRIDDGRLISGILHVLKVGCHGCDCPADYGSSTKVYNRFSRWSRRGFWFKLVQALVDAGVVARITTIDSTNVKAQGSAFSGKRGLQRAQVMNRLNASSLTELLQIALAAGIVSSAGGGRRQRLAV